MWEKELNVALEAVLDASKEILKIYHQGFDVEIKDDDSPVTAADKLADQMIKERLHQAFPSHYFLTEESTDDRERLNHEYVWIIDPIDGTKNFVIKDDMFTINVALAYQHLPVVGVIMIPATNEIYYAVKGQGAYYLNEGKIEEIHVNHDNNNLIMLTSVFHTTAKETQIAHDHSDKIVSVKQVGSSIKACLIAHGKAHVSFRLGSGTKEWDTCASQIIVEQAGGKFTKPNGEEIIYNRDDVYNREGFVIVNIKENNFCK